MQISPLRDRRQNLIGRLIIWRDITELKQIQRELQELAIRDTLTSAFNRRYFSEQAALEVSRAIRFNHSLALVLFDIDQFKRVNDSYGHAAGDAFLRKLVQICQENIREVDLFARIGGEEFALLLPETDSAEAYLVAERLREIFAEQAIEYNGRPITSTLSLGVAVLNSDDDNLDSLLNRADQALYAAKKAGRNCTVVWSQSLNKRSR